MRKTSWIWFVGCAAWLMDGVVQLQVHAIPHAQLAFLVAILFLFAGIYYRQQKQ
jgi:di/tricarboxylate transporter